MFLVCLTGTADPAWFPAAVRPVSAEGGVSEEVVL